MRSALDGRLLVITGKGGVGKTTLAAAAGLAAARAGQRTIVVEVGEESRLADLFGVADSQRGVETRLTEQLSSISVDPDAALLEWLQALGGRVSGRVLASSGTFQYFAAAAPGAKELVTMVKIWRLTRTPSRRGARTGGYDLVVLDAPATGHALGMLGAPQTFGAIARVGPIAAQTRQVRELLTDPSSTAYVAVALANEMAVTEVLELQDGLDRQLGRRLHRVIVNALLPRRFTAAEMRAIDSLDGRAGASDDRAVIASAVAAAHAAHDRARAQQNQLARLRRRGLQVVGVPLRWGGRLDLEAVGTIADRLARRL